MKRQAYGYRDQRFFELKILAMHDKNYAFVGWTQISDFMEVGLSGKSPASFFRKGCGHLKKRMRPFSQNMASRQDCPRMDSVLLPMSITSLLKSWLNIWYSSSDIFRLVVSTTRGWGGCSRRYAGYLWGYWFSQNPHLNKSQKLVVMSLLKSICLLLCRTLFENRETDAV